MKTVFGILARDLKALLRNPIALLVVGALLVLPGLYAWYCIVANWDPYSNTSGMPIAIVNLDKGAKSDLTGDINIGEQLVEKLEEDDNIGWRFYDNEDEALEDTRLLICYATIVFPEDLSENVVGIFEGKYDSPTIYYYPNEKQNAVATKVTDSAAQTLVKRINQEFSSRVNETLLRKVQGVAEKAEAKADEASGSALAEIKSVQKDIDDVIASLDDAASAMVNWREAVAGSQDALQGAEVQLPAIARALAQGSDDLDKLRAKGDKFSGVFAQSLISSGATLGKLSGTASSALGKASADVSRVSGAVNGVIAELEAILDSLPETDAFKDLRNKISNTLEKLRKLSADISTATDKVSATVKRVNASVRELAKKTGKASSTFTNSIMPGLSSGTSDLANAIAELSGAIKQFEPQVGELEGVLSQTDSVLKRAGVSVADAKVLLAEVSRNLKNTITDLGAIGSALEVDQITNLLDIDPDNLGQFVSSPVQMKTEKIYPVSNYGTAVAPFYTNLALWVGCFILASLIKLEVDRRGFEEASASQRYFGRWLLFVILSLLQSQVICGVDILLGIDCAHPALFMLAGAVCSFVYMNLIYALVITFRNVGKTLCILLLIMQVPGSSGMYPIEMMPDFFQIIHPLLPFTYGIDAMREALCGMYDMKYLGDLAILLLLVPLSLAIGLALRPYLVNLTHMFDEEMGKTGFFASEEHGQGNDFKRLHGLMKAIATSEEHRDEIEERAWKFNRYYPKLKRIGTIVVFGIPFVFLFVMLPFNLMFDLSVDAKLNALFTMLIVLLLVFFALVILEYAQHTIAEETRILGLSLMDESLAADLAELQAMLGEDEPGEGEDPPVLAVPVPDAGEEVDAVPAPDDEVDATSALAPDDVLAGSEETTQRESAETAPPLVLPVPAPKRKGKKAACDDGRKRGGVIRDIFLTDLRLGFQSIIGVVVIVLLVITPSMYAWFNISGSWNPYGKTDGLKVAVANTDEGYKGDLVPITVNIGDNLVSQLRSNGNFDWTFVDRDEAVSGVESGEFYAAIVIPEEFSRSMMTYLTSDTDYPNVLYYTNEKENPIAPIITQKGADSIQENIRVAFTQRVDEVGLTIAYDLVDYVTQPRVSGYAVKMAGHVDDATHDMDKSSTELKSLSDLANTVSDVLKATEVALDGISGAADSAKGALNTAENGATKAANAFSKVSELIKNLFAGSGSSLDDLEYDIDTVLAALQKGAKGAPTELAKLESEIDEWLGVLEDVRDAILEEDEKASTKEIDAIINALKQLRKAVAKAADDSGGVVDKIAETRDELSSLVAEARDGLADASDFYNDNVKSAVRELKGTLSTVSSSTHSIGEGIEATVSSLSGGTAGLSNQLVSLSKGLRKAGKKLGTAAENMKDVKDRLMEALKSGDVKQVKQVLLGSDVSLMSERLAEPVKLRREAMYPVSNFGSSMAPFYTVLSLWVGALVIVSTMRLHVAEERVEELRRRYVKVCPRHEFFGRYCIFGFVSLLQSALVLLGDLLFLNIQCVNPVAFFLLGLFVGQVFSLIVYTISEMFGDVGKALCVILLIMQVAASGGTFPIEMLDPLLSSIAPYLPFFPAMSLLQECVAGVNVDTVVACMLILLVAVAVMLFIGLVVRRPFRKVVDFLEDQLEKTGYM